LGTDQDNTRRGINKSLHNAHYRNRAGPRKLFTIRRLNQSPSIQNQTFGHNTPIVVR
jgi:hypothetical protein